MLAAISDNCPHLQKLSLLVELDDSSAEGTSGEILLDLSQSPPIHTSFSSLRYLCELETILVPTFPEPFQTLGDLPQLKRLILHSAEHEISAQSGPLFGWKDSAFPQLEHLSIMFFDTLDIEEILGVLPLVRKLTTLEVFASSKQDDGWIQNIFLPFLGSMPCLTKVFASFDEGDSMHNFPKLNSTAFNVFPALPLCDVTLAGVSFSDPIDFTPIFPFLTSLTMPDVCALPSLLMSFATIPRLEQLVVEVSFDGDLDPDFGSKPPVCSTLHTLESTFEGLLPHDPLWLDDSAVYVNNFFLFDAAQVDRLLCRFLRRLFPNLRKVIWHNEGKPGSIGYKTAAALKARLDLN
jgi:hypothetical protein